MTGQIAFARTIRALDADDFRASKMGSFFAIILLTLWTWWFVAASIPQYETTTHLQLNHNSAVADFPPTTNIHPGQPAEIKLNDGRIIRAQVEKVTNEPTGPLRVQLNLFPTPDTSHQPPATSPQPPAPSPQPQRPTASIEVNRATPASIVARALR
jgi:hypothetical protein